VIVSDLLVVIVCMVVCCLLVCFVGMCRLFLKDDVFMLGVELVFSCVDEVFGVMDVDDGV